MSEIEVLRVGLLDLVVCVPEDTDIEDLTAYVNAENMCGTQNGWMPADDREDFRVTCANDGSRCHFLYIC